MQEKLLWSITDADLVDNFRQPDLLGDVVWKGPGPWPLFHPSEADPDGGYRLYPYTILFPLTNEPTGSYLLRVSYLVIEPRLAFLEVQVNGVTGHGYLRPRPSQSGEIRLHAGLHTSIYSDGVLEVVIPAALLHQGENRLVLTARDNGEVLRVDRIEAIKRLDRMANSAGFIYQGLSLSQVDETPAARVVPEPSVLYTRQADGSLVEQCQLYVELNGAFGGGTLQLAAAGITQSLQLPAAPFGHLQTKFVLPDGEPQAVPYRAFGAGLDQSGEMLRRRKWKVYITPHAHTDIGYTHRQWEVAERLCRNIDTALDLIAADKTGSFTYHLDSSWALETYLQTRGLDRRRQFFAAVQAGKIGVAANYADILTQIAGLEDLIRNVEVTEQMLRPEKLHSDFAAVVDVASITSSMPAVLSGAGVRYLAHANNQDRGPFRLNSGGLHRKSPFWWEGQAGGRILVWLAKMYCELRKVCGSPPVVDSAEWGLEMWLWEYERPDYKPDAVMLYGMEADNTDIDAQPVSFVARWNQTYAYPQLVPSDVSSYFRYVEERFGNDLTVVKGDSGAYWEDGAGSSIVPTMQVRNAQAALPAAERLEALAAIHTPQWLFPQGQFDEAWRNVLLYDEHTWGAFLSAGDPEAWLAEDQWAVKEGFAKEAGSWATRLLHVAASRHSLNWNNNGREVVVYNPHSWPTGGTVRVEVEPNEVVVDPATGKPLPAVRLRTLNTQAWVEFWVDNVPGLSYRRFVLQRQPEGTPSAVDVDASAAAPILENEYYRLTFDSQLGCITSWVEKETGRELVDTNDMWGLGQFLYASGGEGTRLISNANNLPEGDPAVMAQFSLTHVQQERFAHGERLVLTGEVPLGELTLEVTLPAGAKQVDLRYTYRKTATKGKEAVYIAFPLALPAAKVESDSQLGWVDWDKDELPGGCKEWLPLQSTILATGAGAAVAIASPDIPLFCVGDVVRGRWPKEMDLTGGRIFSYVLNNYWHTNYKGTQGGEITFRYSLTSGSAIDKATAYRFGWAARRPLYGHRMSFQDFRPVRAPYAAETGGTLAHIGSDQVVLSTLRMARWAPGYLIRLQEIGGQDHQEVPVSIPGQRIVRAWVTNLLERDEVEWPIAADGSVVVRVPAWGLTTLRVEFAPAKEEAPST